MIAASYSLIAMFLVGRSFYFFATFNFILPGTKTHIFFKENGKICRILYADQSGNFIGFQVGGQQQFLGFVDPDFCQRLSDGFAGYFFKEAA